MSQTKAQRRKQQKNGKRRKAIVKARNAEHNAPARRWRLDVHYEGRWIAGFRHFRKREQMQAFRDETEKLRREGVEITAGRIIDLQIGKVVIEIPASPARPTEKGALPDKWADKPATASKGILGFRKKSQNP
jgi:hypothetical protein